MLLGISPDELFSRYQCLSITITSFFIDTSQLNQDILNIYHIAEYHILGSFPNKNHYLIMYPGADVLI